MWGRFMGKKAAGFFFSVFALSLAVEASAFALEKAFPDLNQDRAFRNAVETALAEQKISFVFIDQDGISREFVIDYDPSFFLSARSRPEPESLHEFLSLLHYEGTGVRSSVNDRMEYHAYLEVRSPKITEWEEQNGRQWEGTGENFQGAWDVKRLPSFSFYLTALDENEEESDILYLNDQGRIKMSFYIQVTNLVRKFKQEKLQEADEKLSELNQKIGEAELYKEEITQMLLGQKYQKLYTDYMAGRKGLSDFHRFKSWIELQERESGEVKYQEYLKALRAERQSQLEMSLGKALFTTSIMEYVRVATNLPEKVILQILREQNL
jgi:hypothetical protein